MIMFFSSGGDVSGGSCPTAGEIATAVWEARLADHTTSGTYGAFVKKILTLAKFLGLK